MMKRYLLALAILILAVLIYDSDPKSIANYLSGVNPLFYLLLPLPGLFTSVLRTYRWRMLLGKNISLPSLFPIQMAGIAISNITPGRLGEPAKALFLKNAEGIRVSKSLQSIIWERILDLTLLLILALLFLTSYLGRLSESILTIGILGVAFVIAVCATMIYGLYNQKAGYFLLGLAQKIPYVKKKITKDFLKSFYETDGMSGKLLFNSFLLSAVIWMLDSVTYYLAFYALGVTGYSLFFYATLIAFAIFAGLVSFLPGGIGSTEAVLIFVMTINGVPQSLGAAGALLGRAFSLWLALAIGFLSIFYLAKIGVKGGEKFGAK